MSVFLSIIKTSENSDFMCLSLSFSTVDSLHEYVAYGYIAWMREWTCNKPNSCHSYFWNIPFLICSSSNETGLFRFETLMFCQYLERKRWPWTQEVKGVVIIGPLVWDQCTVVPSHVGCLDIPLSQTLNMKCILHVNTNSVLLLLFTSLPMASLPLGLPSLLSLSWVLLTNHQNTFRVYHNLLSPLFLRSSVSSLEWGGLNTGTGRLSACVLQSLVQLLHSLESVKQSNSNCDWQDREQSWRFPVMRKEESYMLYFHEKELLHPLNQSEVSSKASVKLSIFFIKILFFNIHHLRYKIPPKFTS